MSQGGLIKVASGVLPPSVPMSFVTDAGTAIPAAHILNILGAVVAAGTTPFRTTGAGNTVTVNIQTAQAIASTNASNLGISAYNSAQFTVDANGFVSLKGSGTNPGILGVHPNATTGGGTDPTVADASGNISILGSTVAAGTNPVRTVATAANSLTTQIQFSQALAATDATKVGLCNFNNGQFSTDANGFVSLLGGGQAIDSIGVDASTAPGTNPVVPASNGLVTVTGAQVAAGVVGANVIRSNSVAANTYRMEIQRSTAVASTASVNNGVSHYNSAQFTVDANGFVSTSGSGVLNTLSDDVGTTITPSAGNIQLVGHVVEQGATKFSTVTAGTNLANINPMSSARWIVDPLGFNGTHTTLTGALASATSGDTIFIMAGSSLTENVTLKAGVNITSLMGDSQTPNVTLIGTLAASYSGTATVSNINLQTNSANIASLTGANATILNLTNCNLNCTNNTGISSSGSNAASQVNLSRCTCNLGTTGIGLFDISNGAITASYTTCTNTGGSSTASTISSAATSQFSYCLFNIPISTANTSSIGLFFTSIDSSGTNTTALAVNGTGVSSGSFSRLSGGTATSLTIGSGASFATNGMGLSSTNAAAVSGAGTLTYTNLFNEATRGTLSATTLVAKGTIGINTSTTAAPGYLGERIVASVLSGAPVSLSNGTPANITSISLTPGNWDISAVCSLHGTLTGTAWETAISANSASFTGTVAGDSQVNTPFLSTATADNTVTIPAFRVSLSATTTYFLVTSVAFTVGTATGYGRLSAVRVV